MVEDILIFMQGDLKRALAKPFNFNERHWAMVIDLKNAWDARLSHMVG